MEDIKEFINMRTIKFRAQVMFPEGGIVLRCNKAEGECVYGDLHLQSRIPHIHSLGKKYPINPDTVGQFTGLHDKDGKEIYEGDIMVIYYNYPGLSFKGIATYERARFIIKQINGDGYALFSDYGKEQLEVIGNIHDNPELLK